MGLDIKKIFKGGLFSKWAGLANTLPPQHGTSKDNPSAVAANNAEDLSETAALAIQAAVGGANKANVICIVEVYITW